MKITETNGNSKNRIRGGRISIYIGNTINKKNLVFRMTVPSMYGAKNYCKKHPNGIYGKQFFEAIEKYKNK